VSKADQKSDLKRDMRVARRRWGMENEKKRGLRDERGGKMHGSERGRHLFLSVSLRHHACIDRG